jgi:hypothetical protein
MWRNDGDTRIFVGRVTEVRGLPDSLEQGARVRSAEARIERIETIQGSPSTDAVRFSGVTEIVEPGPNAQSLCLTRMPHQVGEIVVVVEPSGSDRTFVYGREWVSRTTLAPFIERHR